MTGRRAGRSARQRPAAHILGSRVHRGPQGQPVLFRRLQGRVQFVIGRLQRRGQGAAQGGKHGLTALRQVSVVCDDGLHGRPHGGQNKVALFPQDIALLFPNTQTSPHTAWQAAPHRIDPFHQAGS